MDVLVYRYKTLLMQRLADWTTRGYYAWTSGTVQAERALALSEKFDTRYSVKRNIERRRYLKSKGEANAVLLYADLDKVDHLHWWLLVTHGAHPSYDHEPLRDSRTRDNRIEVTGYEMLQLQNDRRNGGKVRWTWQMTADTYAAWEAQIRGAVRGKHARDEVPQILASLMRVPGFHGARTQVDKLKRLLAAEWRRAGRGELDLAMHKTPWIRRIANEKYCVSDWLRDRHPYIVQRALPGQLDLPILAPIQRIAD